MHGRPVAILTASILLMATAYAVNPFLDAPNDKPAAAKFRGAEWGDEIPQEEIPLSARVVTTRIARMPWGAIFKIEFNDLKSHAPQPRKIEPEYFVVTDDQIVLLRKTTIGLKGNLCVYEASHPSGHFKKVVWKKGMGLVEYASGYGAMKDGFRLKREK